MSKTKLDGDALSAAKAIIDLMKLRGVDARWREEVHRQVAILAKLRIPLNVYANSRMLPPSILEGIQRERGLRAGVPKNS